MALPPPPPLAGTADDGWVRLGVSPQDAKGSNAGEASAVEEEVAVLGKGSTSRDDDDDGGGAVEGGADTTPGAAVTELDFCRMTAATSCTRCRTAIWPGSTGVGSVA